MGFAWLASAHLDAQTSTQSPSISADESVRARADALLSQMTVAEKIGQMSQQFDLGDSTDLQERVRSGAIGSLLFVTDPKIINAYQHTAVEQSRLHIPLIFGFDVIHGFHTIFPVPIGMAASWDPSLVQAAQATAALEARAVGIDWAFAPMVDIARDPRWGRIIEGAGEDPYLGSAIARAQVRGFQGDYIGAPDHVLATVKHFAGYGAAEGGRDYDASYISEAQLRNVYFPPFRAAVEAGVGSVMSAYMDLNDVPATGNRWLLTDVLRKEWKFNGFVVSDADAVKNLEVHGFASSASDAAVRAVQAGVNMEMSLGPTAFYTNLPDAVKENRVTERELDNAVRPILEMKIRLGLFEHPYVDESRAATILASEDHRVQARIAAEHSAVLLRNEGILPLDSKHPPKKIAVIGPLADSKADTLGSWTFAENLEETVTPLEGLKKRLGSISEIKYAPGVQIERRFPSPFEMFSHTAKVKAWTDQESAYEFDHAIQLARDSDVAILFLGESALMSGEAASTSTIALPGKQEELLEAVAGTGKPVILVLLNGRPLNITWASTHIPAILEAWFPGTRGGAAIADLLFGSANPGGKLPFTWPRDVGQVPIYYAHNLTHAPLDQGKRYWNEESTPLYPFGYGLSYSKFTYTNLQLDKAEIKEGESIGISVDVQNTSETAGDDVVQLYIHQQSGRSSRPVRELKGFSRITLLPHEKKTVHFALDKNDLMYWSSEERAWVQDDSVFDVWAGTDSTAAALHGNFTVTR